ncbi:MAG TPA: OsmC family protein [Acidimicrobiia bacterium]|nr:OsmC family protein [Acidimicrobiia bacterium]
MTTESIRLSIDQAIGFLSEHPEKARYVDRPAIAVVNGLRAEVTGEHGEKLVSDMPRSVGGGGSAPTPGWFLRAAMASCDATVIAMRAAREGIELSMLQVTVTTESDDRGFLGMDGSLPAGPLNARIEVKIAAEGVPAEKLREIVERADHYSPVTDAVRRAVTTAVVVDVV